MELVITALIVLVSLVLFVGLLWLSSAIRRRFGLNRKRTASEERALTEAHMHSQYIDTFH